MSRIAGSTGSASGWTTCRTKALSRSMTPALFRHWPWAFHQVNPCGNRGVTTWLMNSRHCSRATRSVPFLPVPKYRVSMVAACSPGRQTRPTSVAQPSRTKHRMAATTAPGRTAQPFPFRSCSIFVSIANNSASSQNFCMLSRRFGDVLRLEEARLRKERVVDALHIVADAGLVPRKRGGFIRYGLPCRI